MPVSSWKSIAVVVDPLTGFHGVTHSILEPGAEFITYITDLGMRVRRFDIRTGRQSIPALPSHNEAWRVWRSSVESSGRPGQQYPCGSRR